MNIESLEPSALWGEFAQILDIPHPSYHEERIREHLKAFAAKHELYCVEDEAHNIYIRKGASEGMSSHPGVVLQAHVDMVAQKNKATKFDFLTDPIKAYIEDGWLKAEGTTLGADNGIGVAAMLAVLADKSLKHPPLEALFTASEEVGMDGAMGLKEDLLQGKTLLNLDSEEEGEFCIGCAGGLDLNITFDVEMRPTPSSDFVALRLVVNGLKGGHSGVQIGEGFANANKILFRFLRASKLDLLLCSIDGGGLRNAIPREAEATILVHQDDIAKFYDDINAYEHTIISEYKGVEDSISIKATETAMPEEMIEEDAAACIIWSVCGAPNGLQRLSPVIAGLPECSSNLARIYSEGSQVKLQALLRASQRSEKEALADSIASVFELADADVERSGGYEGWTPKADSAILEVAKDSYRSLFGTEPTVKSIHAGLECGMIGARYPEMDMISFGPTILSPHSPDERVDIASVERFYAHLTDILSKL